MTLDDCTLFVLASYGRENIPEINVRLKEKNCPLPFSEDLIFDALLRLREKGLVETFSFMPSRISFHPRQAYWGVYSNSRDRLEGINNLDDAPMLSFFVIETYSSQSGWVRFTHEPFFSEEKAEARRQEILKEYRSVLGGQSSVRVAYYTEDQWRKDLIEAVLDDRDALRRLVLALDTQTLADLLK
jgi:hypothetical protein